eukprot:3732242-Karenia_brevis.AAC.1
MAFQPHTQECKSRFEEILKEEVKTLEEAVVVTVGELTIEKVGKERRMIKWKQRKLVRREDS